MELAEFVLLECGPSGRGDYWETPLSVTIWGTDYVQWIYSSSYLIFGGWIELKAVIPKEAILKKKKKEKKRQ